MSAALAVVWAALAASAAQAQWQPSPVTVECIDQAARQQNLPREILFAIGMVEGGRVGDLVYNTNGSYDLGVFQINSHWLGLLAGLYGTDRSTIENHLRWNGCFSAEIAAWVLKVKLGEVGGDFWRAVGNYNSTNQPHHDHYLNKVLSRVRAILRGQDGAR